MDVPGAVATSADGISPSGNIVGNYTAPYIAGVSDAAPAYSPAYCTAATSAACIKGLLYRHGKFTTVLFPGHTGAIPQRRQGIAGNHKNRLARPRNSVLGGFQVPPDASAGKVTLQLIATWIPGPTVSIPVGRLLVVKKFHFHIAGRVWEG